MQNPIMNKTDCRVIIYKGKNAYMSTIKTHRT